jgi:hypothetical protein
VPTVIGLQVFNTFVVGLTMFKNMPRQMFGTVQSKMFPRYFFLTSACNILLLGTLLAAPALGGASQRCGQQSVLRVWRFENLRCSQRGSARTLALTPRKQQCHKL